MACLPLIAGLPFRRLLHRNNLLAFIFFTIINATSSVEASEADLESHRVIGLPGQPTTSPIISHYSGYVTVNQDHGRALFYWLFEAQPGPSKKPLVLWLNGGPGCSSIGYGEAAELGPLRVNRNGSGLLFNDFSWYKEANMLFVESPIGVGFSYTNTSSDLDNLDDQFVAEDAYNFLVNWLQLFPQYKVRDFYLAGESYAGHFVPQLAELVYDRSEAGHSKFPKINLKGFIVGNPEMDDLYDNNGLLEFAWSHDVISDGLYDRAKHACNFSLTLWSDACNAAMAAVIVQYSQIDIYNIYAPKCVTNTTSSSLTHTTGGSHGLMRRMRIPGGGYDPCHSKHAEAYFNRADVQSSLHVIAGRGSQVRWEDCSSSIINAYKFNVQSVLPIYKKLVKAGLRIWIYSGDVDGRCPVIGTRSSIEALGLPLLSAWRSWFHLGQVGGRVMEYQGLTYATVRGSGHLVPLDKPSHALTLFHSFLADRRLPATRG